MENFRKIFILILSFLIITSIVYSFLTAHFFDNKINDSFIRLITKDKARDEIVLVIIDDKSISKERFPWRRSLYAEMFDFIQILLKQKW